MKIEAFRLLSIRGFYIITVSRDAASLYHTADTGEITVSISTEKFVLVTMKQMDITFLLRVSHKKKSQTDDEF